MSRVILEKIEVTRLAQHGLALCVREPLQIIFAALQKAGKGLLVFFRDGHIAGDTVQLKTPAIPPVLNGIFGNGAFSIGRLVEINTARHATVFKKGLVVVVVKSLNENAKVF